MARIIVGGYMFRYPLGALLSSTLQYLIGLIKLGHDVFFIEKSKYENASSLSKQGIACRL